MIDWIKRRWEFASSAAVVLGGLLKIFAPAEVASWFGWTALLFATLIAGKVLYDRSARLQAILAKAQHTVGLAVEPTVEPGAAFRGLLPFREDDAAEFARLGRRADV